MLSLILSANFDRFSNAKIEVNKCIDGVVVHMPHISKNDDCNSIEDNIRVAHRNIWNLVSVMNKTVAVFEDDIKALKVNKCRSFVSKLNTSAFDVVYLGDYPIFWAFHAIIWTPRAAQYMLAKTLNCEHVRSKGADLHLKYACEKKRLKCIVANEETQEGYVGRGFFVQDRLHIKSYLHDMENHNIVRKHAANSTKILSRTHKITKRDNFSRFRSINPFRILGLHEFR